MIKDAIGKFSEKYLPAFISIVLSGLSWLLPYQLILRIEKDLSNPILTLVSIFTGVVAASITLILSQSPLPDSIHIKNEYPQCKMLINYHISCIYSGVFCCLTSLVAIIIPSNIDHGSPLFPYIVNKIFFCLWILFLSFSLTFFIRVIILLRILLLLDVAEKSRKQSKKAATPTAASLNSVKQPQAHYGNPTASPESPFPGPPAPHPPANDTQSG